MTDRPILFSGEMVRALLDGRKTQTRRPLKPQPPAECSIHYMLGNESWLPPTEKNPLRHVWEAWGGPLYENRPTGHMAGSHEAIIPFVPGDRLWVRETFWQAHSYPFSLPSGDAADLSMLRSRVVHYAADGNPPNCANRHYGPNGLKNGRFAAPDPYAVWIRRPSIHMPRWASRITLLVDDVKVQRLQDISEDDARAEGTTARPNAHGYKNLHPGWRMDWPAAEPENGWGQISLGSARMAFANVWNTLYPEQSWDANPWVVYPTFRVIKQNIDQIERNAA